MAQRFAIHPTHPQARLTRRAADMIRRGALVAYPTDSCYALGCLSDAGAALERLRRIRGIDERHHLTLMCRDLSEIARYAIVDDARFALIKAATPGSYTFILRARRELPRRLLHPKRRTIGVRIPGHAVAHALLAGLDAPMLSATLILPGDAQPLADADEIGRRIGGQVDLIIDAGSCGAEPSTVIDLTGDTPLVLRQGRGSLAPFSVESV
ncbi:MAG TPA: L-threonylcarbamoyladenylate synthase [Burkholderiales bacterium]|nr:L-threonylcarbamoyladenylate synthase [Burkholderiales bacterium]